MTATVSARRSALPAPRRAAHRARAPLRSLIRARDPPSRAGPLRPRGGDDRAAHRGRRRVRQPHGGRGPGARRRAPDQRGDRAHGRRAAPARRPAHRRPGRARRDARGRDRLLTAGPVLRMKLWTPDGRIVYSDDRASSAGSTRWTLDEAEVLSPARRRRDQRPEPGRERPGARPRHPARGLPAGAHALGPGPALRDLHAAQLARRPHLGDLAAVPADHHRGARAAAARAVPARRAAGPADRRGPGASAS